MPVDFRFAKLSIRGFRGIRDLDVNLPMDKPLHLIGGNNSGKSTVLEAMALVLRDGSFHQFAPDAFDFFHDTTGKPVTEFTVTLHFHADDESHLPAVQGVGPPIPVHGIQVKGTTDKKGYFNHRHVLLDEKDEAILVSSRTSLQREQREMYKGRPNVGWRPRYARLDDIRNEMPDVWLLTPQNLQRSLYERKTGPLQRLSRMLAKHFLEEIWEFEHDGEPHPMPDTLVKTHRLFQKSVEASPFWKNDLKPKSQDTLSQYVGAQAQFMLCPDVHEVEEWLTQQLAVSFAADAGGATTPLKSMGDGWQSLVRLAALDALSQYPVQVADRVVLLVEEPETHLHPHLRRKMRGVLELLADRGWTVLTATHGPEFISFDKPQVVMKFWRKGDNVTGGVFDTGKASSAVKFQEKLNEHGNHEMLFAQRILLCEGKGDFWALRSGLSKLDPTLDLDARSVSLVDAGSAQNLSDYANIAMSLKIPWCVITDEDKLPNGSINSKTEKFRRKVESVRSQEDLSISCPGKLEACLGVPDGRKAKLEWQTENIDPKPLERMEEDHSDFMGVCNTVYQWLCQ